MRKDTCSICKQETTTYIVIDGKIVICSACLVSLIKQVDKLSAFISVIPIGELFKKFRKEE